MLDADAERLSRLSRRSQTCLGDDGRIDQKRKTRMPRQLEEFVHEEARLSPPRLEVEDFYRDLQELGLRVDRLQSRAERLQLRLQNARS